VILIDTNLLVYAWDADSAHHEVARKWLDEQLTYTVRVGLPWHSLIGFLRVVTNPRIFSRPETVRRAWEQAEEWLGCENVWIPEPAASHASILRRMLEHLGGGGANLIPDAHLAALAIEHGLALCSADGDFGRFPGLKWVNPLAPQKIA
jgi:toxin-antitoxin system PIN domain toxin